MTNFISLYCIVVCVCAVSQRHFQSNDSVGSTTSSDDSLSQQIFNVRNPFSRNSSSESYDSSRRKSHSVITGHQKIKLKRSFSDHEEEHGVLEYRDGGSEYGGRRSLRHRRNDQTGTLSGIVNNVLCVTPPPSLALQGKWRRKQLITREIPLTKALPANWREIRERSL